MHMPCGMLMLDALLCAAAWVKYLYNLLKLFYHAEDVVSIVGNLE